VNKLVNVWRLDGSFVLGGVMTVSTLGDSLIERDFPVDDTFVARLKLMYQETVHSAWTDYVGLLKIQVCPI